MPYRLGPTIGLPPSLNVWQAVQTVCTNLSPAPTSALASSGAIAGSTAGFGGPPVLASAGTPWMSSTDFSSGVSRHQVVGDQAGEKEHDAGDQDRGNRPC